MKKIVLCNQKGGVGKTTSTIEIATCLGRKGKRVLLIDFDMQCNTTVYCNSDANAKTIFDVINADCLINDAIQHMSRFDFIAGSPTLSKADKMFVDNEDKYLLDDVLGFVDDKYDYAVIDTTPARNTTLLMAYVAADYIIFPADCDEGARLGIEALLGDIDKLKNSRDKDACHAEILGFILTRYEKTNMHDVAFMNLENMASRYDTNPFVMKVSKAIIMSNIKTMHVAVSDYAASSKTAREYYEIVNEIIRRVEE